MWFRGIYANVFSIDGTVEDVKDSRYGVRLRNGNFHWCDRDQLILIEDKGN